MQNTITQGDCLQILKTMPADSVDFALTDPPYLVRYKDRSGRTIRNDSASTGADVLAAFDQVYRVLKPDSLCVSFYGWNRVDAFMQAWKRAGFRPVGHLVFSKNYASGQAFLRYAHESAYVLAKGRPERPSAPISDVQPWHYSGNHGHPTEKSVGTLQPILEAFTNPGDLVLDPFRRFGQHPGCRGPRRPPLHRHRAGGTVLRPGSTTPGGSGALRGTAETRPATRGAEP